VAGRPGMVQRQGGNDRRLVYRGHGLAGCPCAPAAPPVHRPPRALRPLLRRAAVPGRRAAAGMGGAVDPRHAAPVRELQAPRQGRAGGAVSPSPAADPGRGHGPHHAAVAGGPHPFHPGRLLGPPDLQGRGLPRHRHPLPRLHGVVRPRPAGRDLLLGGDAQALPGERPAVPRDRALETTAAR
jgi:hypothetical protein